VDIKEIRAVQKNKLVREHEERLSELDRNISRHDDNYTKSEADKDYVLQNFPTTLENIIDRIKRTAISGESVIVYSFEGSFKETHLVGLLIASLPLLGYVCKLKNDCLEISW
jgi:hypothetical protein